MTDFLHFSCSCYIWCDQHGLGINFWLTVTFYAQRFICNSSFDYDSCTEIDQNRSRVIFVFTMAFCAQCFARPRFFSPFQEGSYIGSKHNRLWENFCPTMIFYVQRFVSCRFFSIFDAEFCLSSHQNRLGVKFWLTVTIFTRFICDSSFG